MSDAMDEPQRGALNLVRLIGVLLVVASILELGLYWAKCSIPKHHVPMSPVTVSLDLIPAILGFVVLFKARALAEWLADILDL